MAEPPPNSAAQCIFTLSKLDGETKSVEHVFPDALGGRLKIDAVSKAVNSNLGEYVDAPLVNHWLIQAKLNILGIGGKSGRVPNPFKGTGTLKGTDGIRVQYRFDENGKPQQVFTVPKVVYDKVDGKELVSLTFDASEFDKAVEALNKILKKNGLPPKSAEEVKATLVVHRTENPMIELPVKFDLQWYKLGLIKIAYELTWRWLGDNYLQDTQAKLIRGALLDFERDEDFYKRNPLQGDVGPVRDFPHLELFQHDTTSHLGFLLTNDKGISCTVRVFDVFAATIIVATDGHYGMDEGGKFLALNPSTGDKRESTFEEEVAALVDSDAAMRILSLAGEDE